MGALQIILRRCVPKSIESIVGPADEANATQVVDIASQARIEETKVELHAEFSAAFLRSEASQCGDVA